MTQFRTSALVVLINTFIICGPVTAQETEVRNVKQPQPGIPMEEVVVTAPQLLLHLRTQIKNTERQLYSKYNDINQIDDYDIKCRKSARIGSHIRAQNCVPVFFENILAENAQYAMTQEDFSYVRAGRKLRDEHSEKFEALNENLFRVALENPELQTSLRNLHKLKETYKTKRQECMEKPLFLSVIRKC